MGVVWVVRRSLRLLTLLTLMASALCSGQSLAAQDIAAQSDSVVDIVDVRAVAAPDAGRFAPASSALIASRFVPTSASALIASRFTPTSAALIASRFAPTSTSPVLAVDASDADRAAPASAALIVDAPAAWRFEPVAAPVPVSLAPAAFPLVAGEFSPRAERAPPPASA